MIAVHSVFIAKENILWLEEWIDYHMQLGFGPFYLYDNSNVQKKSAFDMKSTNLIPGKKNKYGVCYDEVVPLSEQEVSEILQKIQYKYAGVHIIEWSPTDKTGAVCYNQVEAHNDCLHRLKHTDIAWCASIDMDEFIVLTGYTQIQQYLDGLRGRVTSVVMSQHLFDTRYNHMTELITQVDKTHVDLLPWGHSMKYIYNVADTTFTEVHCCKGSGEHLHVDLNVLCFNHYKINFKDPKKRYKLMKNMNPTVLDAVKANSAQYIVASYLKSPSA